MKSETKIKQNQLLLASLFSHFFWCFYKFFLLFYTQSGKCSLLHSVPASAAVTEVNFMKRLEPLQACYFFFLFAEVNRTVDSMYGGTTKMVFFLDIFSTQYTMRLQSRPGGALGVRSWRLVRTFHEHFFFLWRC